MTIGSLLIIDDDETDLFICGYTIQRFDPTIKVVQALNGREGLEMLRREQPDAIILDINMPVMNGFEFLETYARDFARGLDGPAPLVVMLTSSHLGTDRNKALQYDFVKRYFEKPLTSDNLKALADIIETGRP
ncbi:response regulator receiver domain-containing protein [Rhizobium sp. PP-F2F-G48]|uniref:response regulator n=1 Tax=Rhizobium sp. PP-F2F-G48 TaxID=2135651 RepID=UPI0010445873|nr:response regulator [Rhizobium sp. PP-F2F-G48]TCM58178.1 response regulator receiver domain-containing protein [Rhizobium sp. PP-F2F-G48]